MYLAQDRGVLLCNLSVRVFESVKPSNNGRTQGTSSQGIELIYVTPGHRGDESTCEKLSVTDKRYLEFSGPVRICFTPSVLTVVEGYKKIVYKCTSMVLCKTDRVVKSGLSMSSKAGDEEDRDKLGNLIESYVSSGTTYKDLIAMLSTSVPVKGAKVAGVSARRAEVEDDSGDDTEEDDDEPRHIVKHGPVPKQSKYVDPPSVTNASSSKQPKPTPKYPPRS